MSGKCLRDSNFFCEVKSKWILTMQDFKNERILFSDFLKGGDTEDDCSWTFCAQCLEDSDCRTWYSSDRVGLILCGFQYMFYIFIF